MYTPEVRQLYFTKTISTLRSSELIEGVVGIGSGVIGYSDEYSDIDLMVSTKGIQDVEAAKNYIQNFFTEMDSIHIKELKFRDNIYLVIAFLENGLEFNVSILPTDFLNVKSPLWKVIVDQTGRVTEVMNREGKRFSEKPIKYFVSDDISFEFFYNMRKFYTELKRCNFIYALKMLETVRELILEVQALNENKKLHQFKAYDTLDPHFKAKYLSTYPTVINVEHLLTAAEKVEELFYETVNKSSYHSIDHTLIKLVDKNTSIRQR